MSRTQSHESINDIDSSCSADQSENYASSVRVVALCVSTFLDDGYAKLSNLFLMMLSILIKGSIALHYFRCCQQ